MAPTSSRSAEQGLPIWRHGRKPLAHGIQGLRPDLSRIGPRSVHRWAQLPFWIKSTKSTIAKFTTHPFPINRAQSKTTHRTILIALCVFAVLVSWHPILRVFDPVPVDYNEGWNAYRQNWAAEGLPLYAKPPGFFVTNYPPVSFYIVGFMEILGSPTLVGRMTALLSFALACFLTGVLTIRLTRNKYSGAYAGMCLWCWVALYAPWRIGVNEPQFLGTTFILIGLCVYMRNRRSLTGLIVSSVLFTFGIFTKLNLIALPAAVGIHIASQRRWKDLLVMATVAFSFFGAMIALILSGNGLEFLSNLLCPRALLPLQGLQKSAEYVGIFVAPLLVAAAQTKFYPRPPLLNLLMISLVTTHVTAVAFTIGDGVGQNIFFDSLIAMAIWCGIGFKRAFANDGIAALRIFSVLAPLLPIALLMPNLLTSTVSRIWHEDLIRTDYLADVALLKTLEDPIICEHIQMCYDAGKRMFYDPYFVLDQIKLGKISEDEVVSLIENKKASAVELEIARDETRIMSQSRDRFPLRFIEAMLRNYTPIRFGGGFAIFVPTDTSAKCAATNFESDCDLKLP
jgi:hypothetical protein